jgi:ParB family chromosome partitioning protein
MIQDSGMVITTREEEQDDHYEIVIEIPKNKQEKGGK